MTKKRTQEEERQESPELGLCRQKHFSDPLPALRSMQVPGAKELGYGNLSGR